MNKCHSAEEELEYCKNHITQNPYPSYKDAEHLIKTDSK